MVYNADVRRNTRQFKRLVIMTEANALTMTAAEIKEAQALQSEFFFNLFRYIEWFWEEISDINASEKKATAIHF